MTLSAIVKVPESENIENLSEATQTLLSSLVVVRTDLALSKAVGGYRLVLVCFNAPPGVEPSDYLTTLNGMIAAHGLDWEILRLQEWSPHTEIVDEESVSVVATYKTDGDLTPYLMPQPVADENGNVINTYLPALAVMAGQAPWQ